MADGLGDHAAGEGGGDRPRAAGHPAPVRCVREATLVLERYPLTLAQLYFDGVLPQDRAVPVEVQVGRREASMWRIAGLVMRENRWAEPVMVLQLERFDS